MQNYLRFLAVSSIPILCAPVFGQRAERSTSESLVAIVRSMPPGMAASSIRSLTADGKADVAALDLTENPEAPAELEAAQLESLRSWIAPADAPDADSRIINSRASKLQRLSSAILQSPLEDAEKIHLLTELGFLYRSMHDRLFQRPSELSRQMAYLLSDNGDRTASEIDAHLSSDHGVDSDVKGNLAPAVDLARRMWSLKQPVSTSPQDRPGWHWQYYWHDTEATDWRGKRKTALIRMGYYEESPVVPFRGNILYLEGLSDSMRNHDNLFAALSNAGYRVIAFDYMGQGGSFGKMNWTRLIDSRRPGAQIDKLAGIAWARLRREDSVAGQRTIVMGWSTGGLAAYRMAHRNEADAVILIAPAVGGVKLLSLHSLRASIKLRLSDLTHADYRREPNPHKEPIVPSAPSRVPLMVFNLFKTAWQSSFWKISKEVQGLALLSGKSDPLVNGKRTAATLLRNAPHFAVHLFPNSAHEVHNEIEPIRREATQLILDFLSQLK